MGVIISRRVRHVALTAATAVLCAAMLSASPGLARAGTLSVAYPANPVLARPGSSTVTAIFVTNKGKKRTTYTVTQSNLALGNDGELRYTPGVNPLFADNVTYVPAAFALKPGQRRQVRVVIAVPAGLDPDYYFLGTVVTPAPAGGDIKIVNRIGALVVLNVPGPRDVTVLASFQGLPSVSFGSSSVSGRVHVRNTGISTTQFTTLTTISGFVPARPSKLRDEPRLLPPDRYRDVPVSWSCWLGLGWYTVQSRVVYKVSQLKTRSLVVTRRVYVVFWPWLFLPAIIIALAVWLPWRRHRRRSRTAAARAGGTASGPSVR